MADKQEEKTADKVTVASVNDDLQAFKALVASAIALDTRTPEEKQAQEQEAADAEAAAEKERQKAAEEEQATEEKIRIEAAKQAQLEAAKR